MLTYNKEALTDKERESIDQIVNILARHLDKTQERPSINAAINVSVAALSRILAVAVPPSATGKVSDAIGHAIKLNVDALHELLTEVAKEELREMPS